MLSRDGWGGLAVLAASLLLFALTLGLKDNPLVPIGPGFYPRIVLGVTAVLAAALVVADVASRRKRRAVEEQDIRYGLVIAMFAAFGLYVGALPFLGFRVATLLYLTGSHALLEPPKGAREWFRAALVGAIATAVIYLAFEHYLSVLLPRGRWTGF